jgi:hypothetical protein
MERRIFRNAVGAPAKGGVGVVSLSHYRSGGEVEMVQCLVQI